MASAMPLALLLLCLSSLTLVGQGTSFLDRPMTQVPRRRRLPARPSLKQWQQAAGGAPAEPVLSSGGGGGVRKHGKAALDETLYLDGLRLCYLYEVQAASAAAAPAPSPSATPASGLSIPATQNAISKVPGVFDYTILTGYGTRAQQLPLYFDVSGMSSVRCKPCFSGSGGAPCDRSLDPSRSSSFRTVPCGSPDCAVSSCSSGSCSFSFYNSTFGFGNGTIVTDTLTLSPSAMFENFTVGCMQLDNLFTDGPVIGNIDLSRSRHSLVTRMLLSSPAGIVAFSYCLPTDTDTHGFLDIAPTLSDYSGLAGVKYVPLVTYPSGPSFYFVDLIAISINGKDLPIPPAVFTV